MYRQARCGLCKMHKDFLGRTAAASLSHDSVLFALVALDEQSRPSDQYIGSKCTALPFLPIKHLPLTENAVRIGTAANLALFMFKHYDATEDGEIAQIVTGAFLKMYGGKIEEYLAHFTSITLEDIRLSVRQAKEREREFGKEVEWYLAPMADVAARLLVDLYGSSQTRARFANNWARAHLTALSVLDSLEDRESDIRSGKFSLVDVSSSTPFPSHYDLALTSARQAEYYASLLCGHGVQQAVHLIYQTGLISPLLRIGEGRHE